MVQPSRESAAAELHSPTANITRQTGDLVQFRSPSGNIGCAMSLDGARCDIFERRWTPPPRPADCEGDFGGGVELDRHGAGVTCATDSVHDPQAPVLAYGTGWDLGPVRCVSNRSGVRCTHRGTGRGFEISRDRYRLY